MQAPKDDYVGCIVRLMWEDAFDEADVDVNKMLDKTMCNTYGKVVRQNDYLITVATGENVAEGTVHATNVLWAMVTGVEVLQEAE